MLINTSDALGLYTSKVIDAYRQKSTPTAFLRSFFPTVESPTLEVSIEVQRGFEKVAVDVVRGTDGNRNTFSRSTQKLFVPPYFREWFDATQLQLYDRLYGATQIADSVFSAYINSVADSASELQAKIERAYELQCAQVLTSGIVTVAVGTNVDFKRKAASLVDLTPGSYWADNGVDPVTSLQTGCDFLRQVGKAEGGVFNLILGSTALRDFLNNTAVQNRGKIVQYALDLINMPQRNSVGASFHGEVSVGTYRVRLWSYNQFYDDALTGDSTPYIDPKKVILLPETPKFKLAFGAVPQLITPETMPKMGAFLMNEYIDQRSKSRVVDIESCGLAIPTAVDTIWTAKVVTG